MSNDELKEAFEKFLHAQTTQTAEISLAQMLATPYPNDGRLAAAFHLFQFAYHLGEQNALSANAKEA